MIWFLALAHGSTVFVATDLSDVDHPDVHCDGSELCSLRDAVERANTTPGADVVFVPVGGTLASVLAITEEVALVGAMPSDVMGGGRLLDVQAPTTLEGLRLLGGSASGDGGCITASADLVLRDSQFRGCSATGEGGAVFSTANVWAERVGFVGNAATAGGALASRGWNVDLHSVSMRDNQAVSMGGGLFLANGAQVVGVGSWFEGNHGFDGGAVASVAQDLVRFEQSVFLDNGEEAQPASGIRVAVPPTDRGGAVFVEGSDLHLVDCELQNNGADRGGAVFAAQTPAPVLVDGTTFHLNFARLGASMRVEASEVFATNSTWSSNGPLHRVGTTATVDADVSYDATDPLAAFWGAHLSFHGSPWGEVGRPYDPADYPWMPVPTDHGGHPGGEGGSWCVRVAVGFPTTPGAPSLELWHALGAYSCVGAGVTEGGPSPSVFHYSVDPVVFPPNAAAHVGVELLHDNGGPTRTHGLVGGATAMDAVDCFVADDQRHVARPTTPGDCDAGAFEWQPPPDPPWGGLFPTEGGLVRPWWW